MREAIRVTRDDVLQEILALHRQAAELAEGVGARLKEGVPPERLVPELKEQTQALSRIKASMEKWTRAESAGSEDDDREQLEQLKAAFGELVKVTDDNHRVATQKGFRLTGIGGKPRPIARPKARRPDPEA